MSAHHGAIRYDADVNGFVFTLPRRLHGATPVTHATVVPTPKAKTPETGTDRPLPV